MGADCKSVGLAYEGSNPSPATRYARPPTSAEVGGRDVSQGVVGARAPATAVRSSGCPPRKSQPNAIST